MHIVGVDMATLDVRIGLALAERIAGEIVLRHAVLGSHRESPLEVLSSWLRDNSTRTLLAIDAPLGWPRALASDLGAHRAGEAIATPPHDMFRRQTDQFIHANLGKLPLDVGADRIARTAHAALALLGALRRRLGMPVPLAWTPDFSGIAAIEVYPAATLVTRDLPSTKYKPPPRRDVREAIVKGLAREIRIDERAETLVEEPDVLDAVVCVLAGEDFLAGRALPPSDMATAQREGWIWSAPRRVSGEP